MIANLLKGLLVPNVSSPNLIPSWSEYNPKEIEPFFEFVDGSLTYEVP